MDHTTLFTFNIMRNSDSPRFDHLRDIQIISLHRHNNYTVVDVIVYTLCSLPEKKTRYE